MVPHRATHHNWEIEFVLYSNSSSQKIISENCYTENLSNFRIVTCDIIPIWLGGKMRQKPDAQFFKIV